MRARALQDADGRARLRFTYQPDLSDRDNWRSHADDVEAGRDWSGDCDDLASTVLDLLARASVPLDQLYRLIVSTRRNDAPDHMMACAWDDRGACWIIGDTFGPAYPAQDCPHQPLQYQRMDDIGVWRDGAPWVL